MSATYDVDEDDRRRFRRFLLISLGVHAALLLFLAVGSFFSSPPQIPAAITVDLLARPGPAPAAKPAAKAPAPTPAPPAPPTPPAAKEPPAPVPPPPVAKPEPVPPPPPVKQATVLPKEAMKAPEKVKLAPEPPKVAPAPPQPAAKPPPPQKQASIDDVMSKLRAEAGETAPMPVEEQAAAVDERTGTGANGGAVQVSPEVMAWLKSARIHVRKSWVLAPGFRLEPLATQVRVNLDGAGNVVGEPVIVRRSGNPWYDESVLRAIQKASPLPAPPRAGEWDFLFQPEES